MTEAHSDIESLLRRALAPIEPPTGLSDRLESRFEQLTEAALDELESWELEAIADPRNWANLAYKGTIVAAGTAAAAGLVLVRARQRAKGRTPARWPLRR